MVWFKHAHRIYDIHKTDITLNRVNMFTLHHFRLMVVNQKDER